MGQCPLPCLPVSGRTTLNIFGSIYDNGPSPSARLAPNRKFATENQISLLLRRWQTTSTANPPIIIAHVPGSGTAEVISSWMA
jgi:hypothetical protein